MKRRDPGSWPSSTGRFGAGQRGGPVGHPTSSLSAADLLAVLLCGYLRYDVDDPKRADNDHLIFSKGHASPLLYAVNKAVGAVSDEELLTFRRFGSRLEGHPTPNLPWVDVATGSLGQGLPIGVGVALAGKRLDRLPYRVWVLCGDSEMAEGSMLRVTLRWLGAAVAALAKVVVALDGRFRQLSRLQPPEHRGNPGDDPVDERPAGRVRVLHQESQLPGLRRHAGPLQRRGDVLTVFGIAGGDRSSVLEGAALQLDAHHHLLVATA